MLPSKIFGHESIKPLKAFKLNANKTDLWSSFLHIMSTNILNLYGCRDRVIQEFMHIYIWNPYNE